MQMIKIVMLFVIFLLSNFIGKMIAGKYRYRLDELQEIKNALNIFKTKIKFTYNPIPEIFDEISKNSSKNVGEIFLKAREKMKNQTAGKSWEEAVLESENNLKKEDRQTLSTLSKMLGKCDVEGQISQIDITLDFLEKHIQDAENEKNKNERLYSKLGTIMGLALVIILV